MRLFVTELLRSLARPSFYLAALGTAAVLWLQLFPQNPPTLSADVFDLFCTALTAKGNTFSLPLLAVLACTSSARLTLSCSLHRPVLLRSSRIAFIATHSLLPVILSMVSQLSGLSLFSAFLLTACHFAAFPLDLVTARLASAGIFSLIGSMSSLLTRDTLAAYALPVIVSFALHLLQSHFFPQLLWLDPLSWLAVEGSMLPLTILLLSCLIVHVLLLHREVIRHG